ncbi:hypothetical protein, partial [Nevskia sp.]|uniref:hypothetical protein n=1 Tax=Nevskia sp. TaxID=1929292 RepID=UPI0025FF81AF
STSFRNPMICSSLNRFFTSDLLLHDRTLNATATQFRGDVAVAAETNEAIRVRLLSISLKMLILPTS